jgi:hypothetical protein
MVVAACGPATDVRRPTTAPSPWCTWTEYPGNPIVHPRTGQIIIGDPTFLPGTETPDGKWHMYAYALDGLDHFTSSDGIAWARVESALFGNLHLRPYLVHEGGTYYLFDEYFDTPLSSYIEVRTSPDLVTWSAPQKLLEPTLAWEQSKQRTTGNPFVIRIADRWRLYYSANQVYLGDSIIFEPTHLGLAYADQITGPYVKTGTPFMQTDPNDPYRNLGAGSLKLIPEKIGGRWIGLNNGIYETADGHSHSAIMLLGSADGLTWEPLCDKPILGPKPGWQRAYVYAFDARRVGDTIYLYYNARDGWFEGKEHIGLATLRLPAQ